MAAELQFNIKNVSTPEQTRVVVLKGEIDESNQNHLIKIFEDILGDSSVKNIIFDIENLDYINSGVIGLFASWHGNFVEGNKNFVFAQANDHIFDIIDLVGLTSVIDHFSTIDEACLSFEN